MGRMRLIPILALAACLLACSPEQNWRLISFDGTRFTALLPCKADRATREVPLGGGAGGGAGGGVGAAAAVPVSLAVAGCESGPALLAVMTGTLPPGSDVHAALQGWQQATLKHLQVPSAHAPAGEQTPAAANTPPSGSLPQFQAWQRPGMLALPSAQHLQVQGRRSDGQTVYAQAVWGAWAEDGRLRVLHAVVYAPQAAQVSALANTLFEGLKP